MGIDSISSDIEIFEHDEARIARSGVRVSAMDGTILRGFRYGAIPSTNRTRGSASPASTAPLLCLPDELHSVAQLHPFILSLAALKGAPLQIYALNLRGRGNSDFETTAGTDISTDADDLISFCDAHNLHHIDILATGHGFLPVLLSAPKRPGLVRRLIINDGGPEFDAVGIARETTISKRQKLPSTWDEAASQLKERGGEHFTDFSDEDWLSTAHLHWKDDGGKPAPVIDKNLVRSLNTGDFDSQQPAFWTEFKLFKQMPTMLIRGENSPLITAEIADKMAHEHGALEIVIAPAQGHPPSLELGNLPQTIRDFLVKP